MTKTTTPTPSPNKYPALMWWQIRQLEKQGCFSSDWSRVHIHPATDLRRIQRVQFQGCCTVGEISQRYPASIVVDTLLIDTTLGHGVTIRRVSVIQGAEVGDEAWIVNTGRVSYDPEATCGVGTAVSVLDETGSRPVVIYPGLTAQAAVLMARMPRQAEDEFIPQTHTMIDEMQLPKGIGSKARIIGVGGMHNVAVDRETSVEGARHLHNGTIVNNAPSGRTLAYVGSGVDAENFIIEDGIVTAGTLLRNCYVGQGAQLEKGFTAHDSLFFANCSFENGEACALFAGPYTVSMHKGTLLIGCQTSFMNAGSSTNQSNHMYKLGPVHWGILERGVKTSSNSYLMLGALIGAFSLLMGQHKTHPDSSEFPFSYLFGDEKGATVVVPAVMLRSCGLMRDQLKWPSRDRRQKRKLPLHDRITFEVLNPYTVTRMVEALTTIEGLLRLPADDDRYLRYKGMKISRASLERAQRLYTLAIYKYLSGKLPDGAFTTLPVAGEVEDPAPTGWIDLAGQLLPRKILEKAVKAESVEEREAILTDAFDSYAEVELQWIASYFDATWRRSAEYIAECAAEYDAIVEADRESYRDELSAEQSMLQL